MLKSNIFESSSYQQFLTDFVDDVDTQEEDPAHENRNFDVSRVEGLTEFDLSMLDHVSDNSDDQNLQLMEQEYDGSEDMRKIEQEYDVAENMQRNEQEYDGAEDIKRIEQEYDEMEIIERAYDGSAQNIEDYDGSQSGQHDIKMIEQEYDGSQSSRASTHIDDYPKENPPEHSMDEFANAGNNLQFHTPYKTSAQAPHQTPFYTPSYDHENHKQFYTPSNVHSANDMLIEAKNECQEMRLLNEKLLQSSQDFRQKWQHMELEKNRLEIDYRLRNETSKTEILVISILMYRRTRRKNKKTCSQRSNYWKRVLKPQILPKYKSVQLG